MQNALSRMLFWARRRIEPTLDAERDSVVLPIATYSPWLLDGEFQRVRAAIQDHTLVDLYRCWELWHLLGQVAKVEGDLLEVGVWRGGTGALIGARRQQLGIRGVLHLCDTFEGVVKVSDADSHYRGGEHADTSVETVQQLLDQLAVGGVQIHRGSFPDAAPSELAERRFCFAHIDVDVYESGRQVFEWVWPRLCRGGVVVFDDFGFSTTRGITQLCEELEELPGALLLQSLNGHAVVVRVG